MNILKRKNFDLSVISRYRAPIYGVSIFWIMLFHAEPFAKLHYDFGLPWLKPLDSAISFGSVGVEMFLFLSGVSLYYSFHKNSALRPFIKKRFARIFFPLLLIDGIYWVTRFIITKSPAPFEIISNASLIKFWFSADQQVWFASLIILLYIAYPYIYHFYFDKPKHLPLKCLISVGAVVLLTLTIQNQYPETFNEIEIALDRIPVFLVGCAAGKAVYEKKKLPYYFVLIMLVSLIGSLLFMHFTANSIFVPYSRWAYLFLGIPLTFLLALFFKLTEKRLSFINKLFAFLGSISFNLYISHIAVLRTCGEIPALKLKNVGVYLCALLVSVGIAYLAELIIRFIKKKLKKDNEKT